MGKEKSFFKKRAVLRLRTPAFAVPDCWWSYSKAARSRGERPVAGLLRGQDAAFVAYNVPYAVTAGFRRRRLRFRAICFSWGSWRLWGGKQSPLRCSLAENETRQFLAVKLHGRLGSVAPCSCASSWCCAGALVPRRRLFLALPEFLHSAFPCHPC